MKDKIIINGVEYMCRIAPIEDELTLTIEMTYQEAKELFTEDTLDEAITVFGKRVSLRDFRILTRISDLMNGKLEVCYRKLTDLEKLIELHYGGVN